MPATDEDWSTEYMSLDLAVRVVADLDEAMEHIHRYSTHHTESIITNDLARAERFLAEVDSAVVMVNASTRFTDGGEFGFGAEVGISTQKLHARGPDGAARTDQHQVGCARLGPGARLDFHCPRTEKSHARAREPDHSDERAR